MSTPASSTPSSTRRERPRQTSLKQQQRRWGPHAMGEVAEVACPARFVHLRIVLQSSGTMNPGTTRRTSCRQEFSTAHSVRSTSPSNNCSTARLASNPSLHELPKKPASIPQTALRHTPLASRAAAPTAASSRTSQSCRPACANIAQPADRVSVLRSERKRTHWWHLRHAVGGRRAITPTQARPPTSRAVASSPVGHLHERTQANPGSEGGDSAAVVNRDARETGWGCTRPC